MILSRHMNNLQKTSLVIGLALLVFTLYTYSNSKYGFFYIDDTYNQSDTIYYGHESMVNGVREIDSFWQAIKVYLAWFPVYSITDYEGISKELHIFKEPKIYRAELHYLLLLVGLSAISFFSIRLFKDKDWYMEKLKFRLSVIFSWFCIYIAIKILSNLDEIVKGVIQLIYNFSISVYTDILWLYVQILKFWYWLFY